MKSLTALALSGLFFVAPSKGNSGPRCDVLGVTFSNTVSLSCEAHELDHFLIVSGPGSSGTISALRKDDSEIFFTDATYCSSAGCEYTLQGPRYPDTSEFKGSVKLLVGNPSRRDPLGSAWVDFGNQCSAFYKIQCK